MSTNNFAVRTVTDTIGTAGSLTITADTTDDQVRAWLEGAYGTPEEIRSSVDAAEAEAMISAIDQAVDTLTTERPDRLGYSDYTFEGYLGLSVDFADEDGSDD